MYEECTNPLISKRIFLLNDEGACNLPSMGKPPGGLGAAIRRLREERGLSQRALQKKAGLSPGAISNYELGIHEPSQKSLRAILNALEVPMHLWAAEIEAASHRTANEIRERAHERGQDQPHDDWVSIFTVNGIRPEHVLALIGIAMQEGRANETAMRASACAAAEKIVSAQFSLARIGAVGLKNNGDDDRDTNQ